MWKHWAWRYKLIYTFFKKGKEKMTLTLEQIKLTAIILDDLMNASPYHTYFEWLNIGCLVYTNCLEYSSSKQSETSILKYGSRQLSQKPKLKSPSIKNWSEEYGNFKSSTLSPWYLQAKWYYNKGEICSVKSLIQNCIQY